MHWEGVAAKVCEQRRMKYINVRDGPFDRWGRWHSWTSTQASQKSPSVYQSLQGSNETRFATIGCEKSCDQMSISLCRISLEESPAYRALSYSLGEAATKVKVKCDDLSHGLPLTLRKPSDQIQSIPIAKKAAVQYQSDFQRVSPASCGVSMMY